MAKPRACVSFILNKKVELPENDDRPTDIYHPFQDICQKISELTEFVILVIQTSIFQNLLIYKKLAIFIIYFSCRLMFT